MVLDPDCGNIGNPSKAEPRLGGIPCHVIRTRRALCSSPINRHNHPLCKKLPGLLVLSKDND